MDIIFHICLIVFLAALFFIYGYSKSQNPMLFVILISVIGLITLYQDSTYIVTGYNTSLEINYTANSATSETIPIKTDFNFEWALYLAYISFFLLSIINLTTGEEYNKNKQKV